MPELHDALTQLNAELGYADGKGVCAGFIEKASDAFLLGDQEFDVFEKRMEYIASHENLATQITRVHERIKSQAENHRKNGLSINSFVAKISNWEKNFLRIEAYLEQSNIYTDPNYCRPILGKVLNQYDYDNLAQLAQPEELKKHGGRKKIISFMGMYSQLNLSRLLRILFKIACEIGIRLTISLGSDNHRIGLFYNEKNHSWLLLDIEESKFEIMLKNPMSFVSAADLLRDKIFSCFDDLLHTGFQITLFTTGLKKEEAARWRQALVQDSEFILLYKMITSSRFANNRGVTLPWFAAKTNEIEVLQRLIDARPEFDLNAPSGAGSTPVFIAAQNGNTLAVRMLIAAKNKDGDYRADLSIANKRGITPLMMAANRRQVDIVRMLIAAKNNNGSSRIEIAECRTALKMLENSVEDNSPDWRLEPIRNLLKAKSNRDFQQDMFPKTMRLFIRAQNNLENCFSSIPSVKKPSPSG